MSRTAASPVLLRRPAARAPVGAGADLAACREQLRGGSRTFLAASLLLPADVRDSACALYAFCRAADDAVDLPGANGHDAVARLRERLDRVYRGEPAPTAADRAMAAVVVRHRIPRALPDALIEGFEWDARGLRYESLEALEAYAARVAGSVGAMMSLLMGVRSPEALARACDLGTAMQLSNIARDVGEDARRGRVYLPLAWLREAGIDPDAWLAEPRFDARLADVVRRLVEAAELLYRRVDSGIAMLPRGCRPGIRAARTLYAAIGHEVLRAGGDSVSRRAVVPPARKAALLLGALARGALPTRHVGAGLPPLAANRPLVDAVAAADAAQPPTSRMPSRNLGERVVWLIELFERQERRRQVRRSAGLLS